MHPPTAYKFRIIPTDMNNSITSVQVKYESLRMQYNKVHLEITIGISKTKSKQNLTVNLKNKFLVLKNKELVKVLGYRYSD